MGGYSNCFQLPRKCCDRLFSGQIFFFACACQSFSSKALRPPAERKEKKGGGGNFAERQIIYTPFVGEMLLLALAQFEDRWVLIASAVGPGVTCLQLQQFRKRLVGLRP